MSISPVPLSIEDADLPGSVQAFIREAQDRINFFTDETGSNPIEDFVPSDPWLVYNAIASLKKEFFPPLTGKPLFCEWGSGFGVATAFADMLGFNAFGIEIEKDLVPMARQLSLDFCLESRFALGTFNPNENAEAYESLRHRPDEIDVIFAYPWPKRASELFDLFESLAKPGAFLLTYHGFEDVLVTRKKQ